MSSSSYHDWSRGQRNLGHFATGSERPTTVTVTTSRAPKSDASDAKLLADLVRADRHNHHPIAGDSPDAEAIKVLARAHQNPIWTRTRHTNALRSALREYYPAALVAFEDLAHGDALGVLGRAPSPEQGARLSLTAIQSALKRGGGNAISPPRNPGRAGRRTAGRSRDGHRGVRGHQPRHRRHHRRAKPPNQRARSPRWPPILRHTRTPTSPSPQPGLGVVLGARVLDEFGDDPNRYTDASAAEGLCRIRASGRAAPTYQRLRR